MNMKRRRDKSAPIPEAIPVRGRNSKAPWTVEHGLNPRTNLREHRMLVDLTVGETCPECGADHARATRLHEMGHVSWTPTLWEEQAEAYRENEDGAPTPFVQAVEDGRLNARQNQARLETESLICPEVMRSLVHYHARAEDYETLMALGAASAQSRDWPAFLEAINATKLPDSVRQSIVSLAEAFDSHLGHNTASTFEDTLIWARYLWSEVQDARAELERQAQKRREEEERQERYEREGLKLLDDGLAGELWLDMRMEHPPLNHRVDFMAKRWKTRDEGVVPTRPDRLLTDGKMFSRRIHGGGVALLVDGSGSMSWGDADLRAVLDLVPATVSAIYSSSGDDAESLGVLRVLSRKGRKVDAEQVQPPGGFGNGVDGLALRWLAAQDAEKRIWISDGGVTGRGREQDLWDDVREVMKHGHIMQVYDSNMAMEVVRGQRPFVPGIFQNSGLY